MLEEKLKHAYKENSRQRTIVILVFISVISLSLLFFSVLHPLRDSEQPSKPLLALPVSPSSQKPEAEPTIYDPTNDLALFKEGIKEFDSQLESKISGADLSQWSPEKFNQIIVLKNRAISSFNVGDYKMAIAELQQARDLAEAALEEKDSIFESAISSAAEFFRQNNYKKSNFHINKALAIKADDPVALELQQRISILPQILPLLEKAKIARAENDIKKEYTVLNEILQIDPKRTELTPILQSLKNKIDENNFSQFVENGLAYVEHRKLKEAQTSLSQAAKIFPKRQEISVLKNKIDALGKEIQLEQAIDNAHAAILIDDWVTAHKVYSGAAKAYPNNQDIQEGLQLAVEIISLTQEISSYLHNPHRLASDNVETLALQTLAQAGKLSQKSIALKSLASELKTLISKFEIDANVTIRSDSQTSILVRGVGRVGLVKEKVILLKPGTYIFEGIRPGFKAKLMKVKIPIDQERIYVELVCDEQL
ncbi:MAG: hypothetical protein ISR48_02640 [Alphaproteobacteria bacterium]|nr:hypothetical protein [Alphaproteobacteria bacterium]